MMSRSGIRRVLSIVIFFVLWYLFTSVVKVPYLSNVPPIVDVVREGISYLPTSKYLTNFLFTLARVFLGFILGAAIGIPFGVVMGWKKRFKWLAFPLFEFLRPIPILAWMPLSVIMFTKTEYSISFLIFLGAFFPIALNTYHGVSTISIEQVRAAQSLGSKGKDVLFKVILPAAPMLNIPTIILQYFNRIYASHVI